MLSKEFVTPVAINTLFIVESSDFIILFVADISETDAKFETATKFKLQFYQHAFIFPDY